MPRMNQAKLEKVDPEAERAKRAVIRFRAMLPSLNGYVRAISGRRDLGIVLASGPPRSDGRKIFFEPPIELGDDLDHERMLCDKRHPETMQQYCSACARREDLLIKLYHEIAHNIYGTFESVPSDRTMRKAVENEIEKLDRRRANQINAKIWQRPEPRTYMELAGRIDPFLPVLINALEDIRVDESMFQARKGTRTMFYAMTRDTFVNGVKHLDGSTSEWKDMPLNSQVTVGIFVVGTHYLFDGWFHPKVEAALNDERIQELVSDVDQIETAVGTFQRAFPILERLRELGFCLSEQEYDEKEQEQEDGEPGDSGGESDPEADDQDEAGAGGDQSPDAESDQDDPEAGSEPSEPTGSSEGDEGSGEHGSDVEDGSQGQGGSPSGSDDPQSGADESYDPMDDNSDGSRSESSGNAELDSDDGHSDRSELGDEDESGADRPSDEDGEGGSRSEGSPRGRDSDDSSEGPGEVPEASDEPESELTDGEESSSDGSDQQEDGADDDLLDTGADEGFGGVPLREVFGSPEQAEEDIQAITKHGDHAESASGEQRVSERAIVQAMYFEKESGTVSSVKVHFPGDGCGSDAWTRSANQSPGALRRRGTNLGGENPVEESVLGPALLHMRRVFADNARAAQEVNLRSGRVNARHLAKRAPFHDPRMFQKKRVPGKKSYAVVLGIDISGSTVGVNIALAKQSAYAQAELCSRLGIDFAVYAHSATAVPGGTHQLDMYAIKDFDAPWDKKAESALLSIGSSMENLDGHSLEFYRKMIEKHPATDKIILYYSDGKMPAANYSEELVILQREIDICRRKSITLLGVGIRTDSPTRHGLDTVQVESAADVGKVVRHLESRLLTHR